MASSLFPQMQTSGNSILSKLGQVKGMMNAIQSGNADQIAQQMERANPKFAEFVRLNKGKSAEQILQEAGVNADDVKSILSMLK